MNAARRKNLKSIIARLEELESLREEIREKLAEVIEEEQDALDNMPESLQESDRGQQMQDNIDTMENVTGELDLMDIAGLIDQLQEL